MEEILLYDGDQQVEFELLDTFGVDDKEYSALLNKEDQQIYIMEITINDDEVVFKTIEDQKILDELLSFYIELLDEKVEKQ